MRSRFPAWLVLLSAVTAIGPLSIDMYLPAFPVIAESYGVGRGAVERTLPVFLLGLALGQLFYGPISDRYGRRPPLLAGLAIYVAGSAGCAWAASIDSFTAARLLQAIGGGAGVVMARAVIRDRLDPQASARAVSSLMLVMGLAPILAPLLGGWMLGWSGWRGLFLAQALFGLLCLVWVALGMQETRPLDRIQPLRPGRVLRTYARLLADRRLMLPAGAGALAMAGMFAYITGSPFVLISLHGVDAQQYALIFGLNAAGLIGASQLNGAWLRHAGPAQVLRRTVWVPLLAGGSLLLMHLAGSPPLLLIMLGLFAYVAALGAISPNTGALAMADQGAHAGAASAVLGSLVYAGGMLAGAAVSAMEGESALPMVAVMALCGLGASMLGLLALRHRRPVADPPSSSVDELPT